MSVTSVPPVPPVQAPQVPSRDELVAQATQLIIQRAGHKDQIEAIERQLPAVQAMIQLLVAQEDLAAAAAEAVKS